MYQADQDPPAATALLYDTLMNSRVDTRMEQPGGSTVTPRSASQMGKHMLMGGNRVDRGEHSQDGAPGKW